jgi:hypothetical protein
VTDGWRTSVCEDGGRETIQDGPIATPELVGWGSGRNGAVQFPVSVNILKLELSSRAYLHPRDGSSELSGVSDSERQFAILDRCSGCGLKRHGKKVGRDSSLQEEVVRDCGDVGI